MTEAMPADAGTRNRQGSDMARILCCQWCRVEFERVPIAGGQAALVCIDCDLMGLAHEVERGARPHVAEQKQLQRRRAAR